MQKFQTRVFFDAYIDLEVEAGARWESALIARDKACIMDRDDLFNNIKLSYAFVEVDDGDTLPNLNQQRSIMYEKVFN
jgi:hypothetical protein